MISHKPLTDDDKKHMGQIRCDESDCVCVCFRMKVRMTATSQTMAMRRTGGRTRWLSPASCWSERSLNSGAVSTKTHGSDDSLSPAVMQCVQSDWRCETQQIFDHRTVGAFPLPFKLRKLKLRIENTPNGNVSISQKRPYIEKKVFTLAWGGFSGNAKLYIFLPPELILATLVYACIYMSCATHVSEAALRASFIKIHAYVHIAKICHNPTKFRCHDLLREEKITFLSHNIC